jgi:integrase
MAWLEQHPTSGRFKICFRWGGRKLKKTIKTTSLKDAEAALVRFEENMALLERGRLELPPGADIGTFLLSDGKLVHKPKAEPPPKPLTLGELRDRYVETHSQGAMEADSLKTVAMHLRQFVATLGASYTLQELTLDDLQRHVNRRAHKKYRGRPLSPVTLKKEMASVRAMWNWGVQSGRLKGPFPNRGLVYPKADEKPPFMTWAEIERKLPGLNERQREELWDCLFLQQPEVVELLAHVKAAATLPWVYPAVCFAAHTGARRSEVLRVQLQDLDLEAGHVIIREKKRARGTRTNRRVPLSPFLAGVLEEWLKGHPGGQYLFCNGAVVARSKKRSLTTGHKGAGTRATGLKGRMANVRKRERPAPSGLTKDEAHDHLRRTLAGSRWEVLRGWHVLRHCFISNCAARGVDQRLIDAWVGHTTEEMRKRYRHLIPSVEQAAIRLVFGS